jgi:serine/threonine protein kinase
MNDFVFITRIAKGAFGSVYLVRRIRTTDYYAMKVIQLSINRNRNQFNAVKKENDIYKIIKGDYIAKAYFSFIYQDYLCFVMEYIYGGDLASLLERLGVLEQSHARFYIA